MTNRVQTLRSANPGVRPAGQLPGTLYTNWADNQLGVANASGNPVDLIAVRYFSSLANYVIGDFVWQGGVLYRAIAASSPGAFNAGNWSAVLTAALGSTLYLALAGGTLTGPLVLSADPVSALQPVTLQYLQGGYLAKAGGTMTGALVLAADPAAALQPVTLQYLQNGYLARSGGTMTGPLTLAADPVSALQPTTKQYVDANAASIAVGDTPPLSPNPGKLWFDSVGGQLYVFYQDVNSSQWVTTVNQPGLGLVAVSATPPSAPVQNMLWWDSVGGQLYVWFNDGTSSQWVVANNTQAGVASFNTRQGAVTLQASDITGATPAPLKGVTDGSSAAAGYAGEYVTAAGGPVGLTNNVAANVASISLAAGDWDCWALCTHTISVGCSAVTASVSTTSATIGSPSTSFQMGSASIASHSQNVITIRVSSAGSINVYLVALDNFASGTVSANGILFCRRVR